MNQLTLEIESKNRVISTKDQTFLNKDEEPRIRPQIRECMKRIETVVRKRAINPPDGMLFRLSILCWKDTTQVHVQFASDDEDKRRYVEREIDAIVALMTGREVLPNEPMKDATETIAASDALPECPVCAICKTCEGKGRREVFHTSGGCSDDHFGDCTSECLPRRWSDWERCTACDGTGKNKTNKDTTQT